MSWEVRFAFKQEGFENFGPELHDTDTAFLAETISMRT